MNAAAYEDERAVDHEAGAPVAEEDSARDPFSRRRQAREGRRRQAAELRAVSASTPAQRDPAQPTGNPTEHARDRADGSQPEPGHPVHDGEAAAAGPQSAASAATPGDPAARGEARAQADGTPTTEAQVDEPAVAEPAIEAGPLPGEGAGAVSSDAPAGAAVPAASGELKAPGSAVEPTAAGPGAAGPGPAGGSGGGPSIGGGPDPDALGPQIDDDECTDEDPTAADGGDGEPGGDPGETPASDDLDADAAAPQEPEPAPDISAELAEIAASGPPSEAGLGGGGGGGGGAISETPEPPAPDVSGAVPEAGLAQLTGVRPDQLLGAIGGVGGAVAREATETRATAAADAPTLDLEGGGAEPPKPAPEEASAPQVDAVPEGADSPTPNPEPTPEPAAAPAVAQTPAPAMQGDAEGKLSDGNARNMARSIRSMATRDTSQPTAIGPPPALTATGNADPQQVQSQRETVEAGLSNALTGARTAAGADFGEGRIKHARPARKLTAVPTGASPMPAPAIEAEAGEMMEAAGVVAQVQSGGEIDAAMAKAQAEMAAERQQHEQAQQSARDGSKQELEALRTANAAEQAQERAAAEGEVATLRQDWQSEADKQTSDARTKADAEVEAGLKTVDDEKKKGEDEAQKAIDDGEAKAADERAKGEAEAEKQKQEGEKDSGGILGWLASKAEAFFDRIRKAITAAIDAARKAVKAAIDAAKALASAAIEAARKAIVSAIQIVGKALIAISDVLLAAFPALKEKFRNAIQIRVDQATAAVNALAESLDKGIQKALDALGNGLDAALGLLEKGLHMVVDGLAAVVQGAIKAAEGFINGIAAFAAIIKDVAANPGQWIGNLGAAVVDGIKNHLWGAFKTAVKGWFESKVLEVLGIGGMVVQLLAENGFDLGKIAGVAWDGLKAAIPAALIQILVEKLVSMIVPAAGALMAIIEGLQAAWGTVSRIIAAISTFVEFLKAVKSGNAGPQFATALAAAGVVLIDFVANWLLKKLRKAGRKIGKKLKGLFKKKGKGKKPKKKDTDAKAKKPSKADKLKVAAKARAETRRMEAKGIPAGRMPALLAAKYKPKYPWIRRFDLDQGADGRATVWLIASRHKVGDVDVKNGKVAQELAKLKSFIADAQKAAIDDPEASRSLEGLMDSATKVDLNTNAAKTEIRALKARAKALLGQTSDSGIEDKRAGNKKTDSSKNEKHGDGGRAKKKAEEQIKGLEGRLKDGKLGRRERQKIKQKIKNIRKIAEDSDDGEEHSRANKR